MAGVIRHTCQYDQVLDEEVRLLSITDLRSYFLDEETRNNVSQAFMIATILNLHYDFCIEGHSHLRLCSELGYGPHCKKRVVDFVHDGDLQTLSFRRSVIKLKRVLPLVVMAGAFLAVYFFKVNIILVILISGFVGGFDTWRREKAGRERG